ncbi:uncharacterized protein LOC112461385 isoform X5 [Temnothorax curvispinosus]|uniref:Uncharacterized protein LOC112461385 isoform X5 n=1 Tax=Temnothorax curvispinosus TaxID=300111 RepID=A0A6J1QKF5_9HYME|nr:uncharacterized protein LOC112461385 isoform X5 [Temnothorax curvispinosus]
MADLPDKSISQHLLELNTLDILDTMHKNTDENNQPKSPSVLSTRKRRKTSIEKHEAANILHNIEQNFTQDVSVANATANATVSKNSATTSEISDEEVIEVSPTQRSVPSQLRFKSKLELLKLKRKIPIKRINFGTNNIDSFNLDDRENKPPKKKFNVWSKGKDISEQLNMRCKADRAKLNGWDCWECREYYKNLSLSKEEEQKRKNRSSRHRRKYERPNTPEGFWNPEFPETLSSTYRTE